MAVIKVRDEVEFLGYLGGLTADVMQGPTVLKPKIQYLQEVVYVDAGDDIDKRVKDYLANTKVTGLVLFVWLGEGGSSLGPGQSSFELRGLFCLLGQVPDKKSATLLGIRKKTRECLLNILGRIDCDMEEAMLSDFVDRWEFRQEDNRFLPSSEVAGTSSYGWLVSFELWIECGKVVYEGVEQFLG
jgi:hypothetical protein